MAFAVCSGPPHAHSIVIKVVAISLDVISIIGAWILRFIFVIKPIFIFTVKIVLTVTLILIWFAIVNLLTVTWVFLFRVFVVFFCIRGRFICIRHRILSERLLEPGSAPWVVGRSLVVVHASSEEPIYSLQDDEVAAAVSSFEFLIIVQSVQLSYLRASLSLRE